MTWILTVAVIAALVISLLNLTLTFAIVRRMRDNPTEPGHGHGQQHGNHSMSLVPVGARVGPFRATTPGGVVVTTEDVATDSVVAFVSATCETCKQVLEQLERQQHTLGTLVVFVFGVEADVEAIAARLSAARVAMAAVGGDVAAAFGGIDGYPRVVRVTGGVIARGGITLEHLEKDYQFAHTP
ncbi:hypothetical protein ACFFX1_22910 [Dactylosporangium sucinum]|uniref:Thioredoxin domain-containing protein n=1 Tax=Dactylosporangium sucinum TaxID=1424081 RepID=A0A917U0X8_9ACTN|nr:hypothetical protein [Dactylosporangium sucinum]GGM49479.1 hypothetical protein GCM10007977_058920 [Dactylosporangium sucinum]